MLVTTVNGFFIVFCWTLIVYPDCCTERAFGSKNMQGPLTEFGLLIVSVGIRWSWLLSISYSISIAFVSVSGGVLTPCCMTFKACSASRGVKPWPALLFLKRANLVYLSMFSINFWCSGNLIPYGNCVIGLDGSILLMLPSFCGRYPNVPINGFLLFFRSRLTSIRGESCLV